VICEGIATYTEREVLHHISNPPKLAHGFVRAIASRSNEILNTPVRVNLHGTEVVEPVYEPRILAELLIEGIAEIVGRVGGDEEHRFAVFGELYGECARRRRLSYTTFPTDEYPAQRLLVEDVL
jgi:hypothetical protein